jgi:hypothetical protein
VYVGAETILSLCKQNGNRGFITGYSISKTSVLQTENLGWREIVVACRNNFHYSSEGGKLDYVFWNEHFLNGNQQRGFDLTMTNLKISAQKCGTSSTADCQRTILYHAVCCLIPAMTIKDPVNRKISVMATGCKMIVRDIISWNKNIN